MVEQFVMQINIYTFSGERGNPIEISFTFNSTNKELKGLHSFSCNRQKTSRTKQKLDGTWNLK
jgi:hypothetical protein